MALFSAHDQKMAQTSSNEVFFPKENDYHQWKDSVTDYKIKKQEFQGEAPKYNKVTTKFIKAQETRYNPITQVYTNPQTESTVRSQQDATFINQLAKNKDNALRYEQTYNVLNFQNKLAGLEERPDYPKEKPWYFRPERDSLVDYNIISNYQLQDHHYDAPEKRPDCKEFVVKIPENKNKNFKDYNVISNKYLEHHDQKIVADEKIQKAEAAERYWKTHDFDLVNGQYFDASKEAEYVQKREDEARIHGQDEVNKLPLTVRNDGLMYNPVNMKIEDEKRLYERDLREKNKKARYEVRYDVEQIVRKESLAEQDRFDSMKLNKVSGLRYQEETKRGFNIMNNQQLQGKGAEIKMDKVGESSAQNAWNGVLQNANEHQQLADQRRLLSEEEYYQKLKERGINAEFKKSELDKLSSMGAGDAMRQTTYENRSKRITRQGFESTGQVAPASQGSRMKSQASAKPELPQSQAVNPACNPSQRSQASKVSAAPPQSNHSAKQSAPVSSQRAIRTGGFSNLGSQIVAN